MDDHGAIVLLELGGVILGLGILGRLAGRLGLSAIPLYLPITAVAGMWGRASALQNRSCPPVGSRAAPAGCCKGPVRG